jgi:hypothetical protein
MIFAFGMIFLVPQLFLIGLWTMGNATGCGLILADSNGGEILREAPEHRMAAATRRAVLMRFAHAAAHRLHRLSDPEVLAAAARRGVVHLCTFLSLVIYRCKEKTWRTVRDNNTRLSFIWWYGAGCLS